MYIEHKAVLKHGITECFSILNHKKGKVDDVIRFRKLVADVQEEFKKESPSEEYRLSEADCEEL